LNSSLEVSEDFKIIISLEEDLCLLGCDAIQKGDVHVSEKYTAVVFRTEERAKRGRKWYGLRKSNALGARTATDVLPKFPRNLLPTSSG
jgi:hypothetical protein